MDTTLGDAVGRAARGAMERYVGGALWRWDSIYARGFGDARAGAPPRAKHYVVAGIVADACGWAPRVLDVGAGFGTTYRLLRRLSPTYVGVEASSRAVARCRERFRDDAGASFEVGSFEDYDASGVFDAILLDEALQRFPRAAAPRLVDKAISWLRGPSSVLVISLSSPLRGSLLGAALQRSLPEPHQRIAVRSGPLAAIGGRSVVLSFTNLRGEVEHERAAPPRSGVGTASISEPPASRVWDTLGLSRTLRPARSATGPSRTRQR
jgi:SAM-dependent methyltransferase